MEHFPNGSACTSSHTGRTVAMSDERYEVSLCDLLDSNLDVVLHDDIISWRQDTTDVWVYILISVLCIYLISCISENIVSSIHNKQQNDFRHQQITVYVSVMFIIYLFAVDDSAQFLATSEDLSLMLHLFIYIIVELSAQSLNFVHEVHGSRISLLTACISLLTLRVHYSFDNPYMLILCIMFGTRSMFKFIASHTLRTSVVEFVVQNLDMFVFCSMLENGLMSNSSDYFSGLASLLVVILVCFLFAIQIFVYKVTK